MKRTWHVVKLLQTSEGWEARVTEKTFQTEGILTEGQLKQALINFLVEKNEVSGLYAYLPFERTDLLNKIKPIFFVRKGEFTF